MACFWQAALKFTFPGLLWENQILQKIQVNNTCLFCLDRLESGSFACKGREILNAASAFYFFFNDCISWNLVVLWVPQKPCIEDKVMQACISLDSLPTSIRAVPVNVFLWKRVAAAKEKVCKPHLGFREEVIWFLPNSINFFLHFPQIQSYSSRLG